MSKVKEIITGKRNTNQKDGPVHQSQVNSRRSTGRDTRIVMWYGGQRVELPADAWLRGH